MKTILDLTQEFAALDDTKTRHGGTLPPASGKRWAELKAFYDLLMAQSGLPKPVRRRFTAVDIRQKVVPRARLRVRAEMDIAVLLQSEYHSGRVMNLSCGGVLLAASTFFDVASQLRLYLAAIGRGIVTEGEVVWGTKLEGADGLLLHRVGIRFVALPGIAQEKLDAFVVEILEKQLRVLDAESLDSDFVRREALVL